MFAKFLFTVKTNLNAVVLVYSENTLKAKEHFKGFREGVRGRCPCFSLPHVLAL